MIFLKFQPPSWQQPYSLLCNYESLASRQRGRSFIRDVCRISKTSPGNTDTEIKKKKTNKITKLLKNTSTNVPHRNLNLEQILQINNRRPCMTHSKFTPLACSPGEVNLQGALVQYAHEQRLPETSVSWSHLSLVTLKMCHL